MRDVLYEAEQEEIGRIRDQIADLQQRKSDAEDEEEKARINLEIARLKKDLSDLKDEIKPEEFSGGGRYMSRARFVLREFHALEQQAMDVEVQKKLDEFISLYREMKSLEARIEVLSARSDILQKELVPIIKESAEQMALVENATVKYKTRAVTSLSYKTLFEQALGKVNKQTRAILEDLKEKLTSSYVKEFLDVKAESWFTDLVDKFRNWIRSVVEKLGVLKSAVAELLSVAQREPSESEAFRYGDKIRSAVDKAVTLFHNKGSITKDDVVSVLIKVLGRMGWVAEDVEEVVDQLRSAHGIRVKESR